MEKSEEGEKHARALFNNPTEEELVEFEQFKEAVAKLAEEQKKSFEEISKILAEEGPKLAEAINAGLMAFKGSMVNLSSSKYIFFFIDIHIHTYICRYKLIYIIVRHERHGLSISKFGRTVNSDRGG